MAAQVRRRWLLLTTVLGCAAGAVAVAVVASGSHRSAGSPTALRVLQMNLCNSGIAGCYTGRSVATAAAVIAREDPELVTLNEVCRDDVATLDRTLAKTVGGQTVTAFRPAVDRRDGGPVHCVNGEDYGIGLLVRAAAGAPTYGGDYPIQDGSDVEGRVWLCVRTAIYACTTHLDSVGPADAYRQCQYLLQTAIPAMIATHGPDPVVLAGDLNLEDGHSPDPRTCFPGGYAHADDGARQHVVAHGFRVVSSRTIDMNGTTDHPGLLVDLALTG